MCSFWDSLAGDEKEKENKKKGEKASNVPMVLFFKSQHPFSESPKYDSRPCEFPSLPPRACD